MEEILHAICKELTVKKHRSAVKDRLGSLLYGILAALGRYVDMCLHDLVSEDFEDLPLQQGRLGKRPSKIPQRYRIAASLAARKSSNKRAFAQGPGN
eukprot:1596801-Amphidinium_carterae.1